MIHTKLFLLFILFDSILSIKYWSYTDFKNPIKNPNFCKVHKKDKTFICDPEKYLTKDTKRTVGSFLKDIKLKSPSSCNSLNKMKSEGLTIGVIILSKIKSFQPDCDVIENAHTCFIRNIMEDWRMSSCENDAMILIEEASDSTKGSVYFGKNVINSVSRTCINRIKRDVELSLFSSAYLEIVINKIYIYTTDSNYCMKVQEPVLWQIKTELLIGLIIATGCIVILFIFMVPYCRKRSEFSETRNSNIVRPMNAMNIPIKDSEFPPRYSEVVYDIKQMESSIVVIDAASDSTEPPSYLHVTNSPQYTFKKDFQLKI